MTKPQKRFAFVTTDGGVRHWPPLPKARPQAPTPAPVPPQAPAPDVKPPASGEPGAGVQGPGPGGAGVRST